MVKKPLTVSTKGLTKCTEQNSSEQVDDDEEVTVPVCKGRKVATTIAGAKPMDRKLLTTSAKEALEKDMRDVNLRKV